MTKIEVNLKQRKKKSKYIITHKKLSNAEMKRRNLIYDGWGKKKDSLSKDFYYIRGKPKIRRKPYTGHFIFLLIFLASLRLSASGLMTQKSPDTIHTIPRNLASILLYPLNRIFFSPFLHYTLITSNKRPHGSANS